MKALVIPVLAVAVVLSGCSNEYPDATAQALQGSVAEITTASAAGDLAGATALLGSLRAEAVTARDEGRITDERYDRIVAALDLVAAELAALQVPPPEPTPAPAPEPAPAPAEDSGGNGNGNGNNGNGNGKKGNDRDD